MRHYYLQTGINELSYEMPNDLRLGILGNLGISGKCLRATE